MLGYINKISLLIFVITSFFFVWELINFIREYKKGKIKLPGFSENLVRKEKIKQATPLKLKKPVVYRINYKFVFPVVILFLIFVGFSFISLTTTQRSSAVLETPTPYFLNRISPTVDNKFLTPTLTISPVVTLTPVSITVSPTPTEEINLTPSPTLLAQADTGSFASASATLTPKDIVIAKVSPTQLKEISPSSSPTAVKKLPTAGYYYYNIFLFAVGAFIIVFSLVI